MPDPTPSPEKPRFAGIGLEAVAISSLTLNAVILVLLIVAFVGHHRHGCGNRMGAMPGGPGPGMAWHHEGGPEGQGHPDFDRDRDHDQGPGERAEGMGHEGMEALPPDQIADRIVGHLDRKLTLTEPQKTQIKALLIQHVEAVRKAHEDAQAATHAKIRALLTSEQQKTFDLEKRPEPGQLPQPGSDKH